ncbi:MAG: asparagine synthase-related protein [Nitrosopumilaceae archaeon]
MENFVEELRAAIEKSTSKCKAITIALSGGLDSSILAYYLKDKNAKAIAVTSKDFIATDLTYCQLVAKQFNLPLKIIMPTIEELLNSINETIKILKNFNDIEIRNSIIMYLILKTAKEEGDLKIISGDGADELFAGYSFFLKKNNIELQNDLLRIWNIMHFPSKKIGDALGITVETPFLDDDVIDLAKKIPANFKVNEFKGKKYGKWILRKAYEEKLPKNIVWREKSPMQDGAGTAALTHLFETVIPDEVFEKKTKQIEKSDNVKLRTKESLHYYEVYRKYNEPPEKLHSSKNKCPYCRYEIKQGSKFCRMCGSFPI